MLKPKPTITSIFQSIDVIVGFLFYAKTSEDGLPCGRSVRIGGNCIGIEVIDLNRDFKDIANQLEIIIKNYI